MYLVVHISSAVISVLYASYTALSPSKSKLRITYLLTLATILSGSVLAIISGASFGKACLSGIVYIGIMITITTIIKKRLMASQARE